MGTLPKFLNNPGNVPKHLPAGLQIAFACDIIYLMEIIKRVKYQHKNLAAGRWEQLSFLEQMANIGSEVERALNWKTKKNNAYCVLAVERALELLDLTTEGINPFDKPRTKAQGLLRVDTESGNCCPRPKGRGLEAAERIKISSHLKELFRLREAIADYFLGENLFGSSDVLWRKYFFQFSFAARKNH